MTIDRKSVFGLALAASVAAGPLACEGGGSSAGDARASAPDREFTRVVNVEVQPVDRTSFREEIRLTGTVEAWQDVELSAEESGRIEELLVEKGARVSRGDPIVRIDDAILRAQVEQARARASLARELWERRQRLWEEERVGTEQAYLEARYNAEEAAANLRNLEERLANTVVRAPFDGILEDRMVEVGEMVSPGMPVVRVVQIDTVKVTAGVPERFANDVEPGSQVRVGFDVLPDEIFEGEITYVGSTINPGNRTFPVEFTVENPDRLIKPEMIADLSVLRRVRDDAVVVAQPALVRTEDGFRAFVVVEDDEGREVAEARDVEVGPAQRDRVVVEDGLSAGERLVVVGQQQVADGDRVRVVDTEPPLPEIDPDTIPPGPASAEGGGAGVGTEPGPPQETGPTEDGEAPAAPGASTGGADR